MASQHDVTRRLRLAREGDKDALNEVFDLVYEELFRLAKGHRRRWSGDRTMDTVALVHEAYLKLVNQENPDWNDRGHFLAVAARAMRHLLLNYAERRRAGKRGGGQQPIPLEEFNPVAEEVADEVLALNECLQRLATVSPRQVSVVESRFFLGLSIQETAEALSVSPATVKRDWQLASAWLQREIQGG